MEEIQKTLAGISIGSVTLARLIPALLTFLICLGAIRLLTKFTDRLLGRSKKLDGTLRGFIRSAVRIIMWLFTAIIVADSLGIPTTSLVALVSVAGLALSLAIQNVMANLFSGVTLLVTKPFAAGDYVDLGGKSGVIKTVGLFYTVMDSFDNTVISMPNSDVTASAIKNYSAEPLRRVDLRFCASYEDETEKVKASILRAVSGDSRILRDPAPFVSIEEYKASSIEYIVRVWCSTQDYWDVYYYMNETVRACFREDGVQMSYEHMNVHIISDQPTDSPR